MFSKYLLSQTEPQHQGKSPGSHPEGLISQENPTFQANQASCPLPPHPAEWENSEWLPRQRQQAGGRCSTLGLGREGLGVTALPGDGDHHNPGCVHGEISNPDPPPAKRVSGSKYPSTWSTMQKQGKDALT